MLQKKLGFALMCIAVMALAAGCSTTRQQPAFTPVDLNPQLQDGSLTSNVGGFLIVLDASASMAQRYKGMSKVHHAVNFLDQMNRSLPAIDATAGMRVFGRGESVFESASNRVYGMTAYNQQDLGAAINAVDTAGGSSPMHVAVGDAADDLAQIPTGRIAAILVSDWHALDPGTVEKARAAKERFGDRFCINPVMVGDSPQGMALMDQFTKIGGCGVAVSADAVNSPEAMADYVKTVFLAQSDAPRDADGDGVADVGDQCPDTPPGSVVNAQGCRPDSDGDGVFDISDRCPGTLSGSEVDYFGCPPDSDGDGVWDVSDKCPGTPAGAAVDNVGCPQDNDRDNVADYMDECPGTPLGADVDNRGCWVLDDVKFASGRSNINSAAAAELNRVAAVLKSNPSVNVEIQGHTDNTGSDEANQRLSEKRARAVMGHLVDQGISAQRIGARGLGESRPIAVNDTPEGRAINRRVEITPID